MGITVGWDHEEKKVIRWDFDRNWRWDDFQRAVDQSVVMSNEIDYPVDIIVNLTETPFFPPGSIVSNVKRGMLAATQRNGKVILTGGNAFANAYMECPNYLPPNALSQMASLQRRWPVNADFMVIIGSRMFIKTMISIVGKVNRSWGERFRFADTVEEARTLIAGQIKP